MLLPREPSFDLGRARSPELFLLSGPVLEVWGPSLAGRYYCYLHGRIHLQRATALGEAESRDLSLSSQGEQAEYFSSLETARALVVGQVFRQIYLMPAFVNCKGTGVLMVCTC